ncbi:MAG: sigma-54 dependent transcriptional regulator [Thermoanaerobaculum sp.]|nr:sigma-54 dependent transcriptional regulator [Thermoanaerobaculum sp.]
MSGPVLVVEDREPLARVLAETLAREGYTVEVCLRGDEAVERIAHGPTLLAVISDLKLPGADGLEVLRVARERDPQLPVFLITAFASVETAVQALKLGARDYFPKPLEMPRLLVALRAAASARGQLLSVEPAAGAPTLVGTSPRFLAALEALRRVAPTEASVLLLGESGTGKELFARSLHAYSPRHQGPFVAFACAAVPETLLEAELFGYERGAFTGATSRHVGRFEQASGGTLFLDEIGEVGPAVQVKLLRALEERRITRLGGKGEVSVDVRLVAATNRDLETEVLRGSFRADLYHRLNVFPITLPPLRERREDIPALALHLLTRACAKNSVPLPLLRPAALGALVLPSWPGNVRQLANLMERVAILSAGERVGPRELSLPQELLRPGWEVPEVRQLALHFAGEEGAELERYLAE